MVDRATLDIAQNRFCILGVNGISAATFRPVYLRRADSWHGGNTAGRMQRIVCLILFNHLFDLFPRFRRNPFEGAIFSARRFALCRGELAPLRQAVVKALFVLGFQMGVAFGRFKQAVLLYLRQGVPLLRQWGKRFLLSGGKGAPWCRCSAGRRASHGQHQTDGNQIIP